MTTTITGATGIDNIKAATGAVLQVVQTVLSTAFSTSTTGAYVDVGLSVSITPTSVNSKLLITLSSNHSAVATGWSQGQLALSDNTELMTTFARAETTLIAFPFTHVYLHSPSTTSSVTYKMRVKGESGTTYVNRPAGSGSFVFPSTITVQEIAG